MYVSIFWDGILKEEENKGFSTLSESEIGNLNSRDKKVISLIENTYVPVLNIKMN